MSFAATSPATATGERPDSAPDRPSVDVPSEMRKLSCEQLAGVTIVAVDDEADGVNMIRRLLTDCGVSVRTANSAAIAFELVQAEPPMVLISDIGMPGEDGYALIRRIRALSAEQGNRTPAIALTAYARAADRVKSLSAGFQMHLSKPIDPAELIASVAA